MQVSIEWARDLVPTTALRRWFGHEPARWDEFRVRYERELDVSATAVALDGLAGRAKTERVTLVYSARDRDDNQARVLADVIEDRMGQ